MTPDLAELSRTVTALGLGPTGQAAVLVLISLWVGLAAFKPRGRHAAWLALVPAPGSAERLALEEVALVIAAACLTILVALGLSWGLWAISRWWGTRRWEDRRAKTMRALGIPKVRPLSEKWKREKDREELSAEREKEEGS